MRARNGRRGLSSTGPLGISWSGWAWPAWRSCPSSPPSCQIMSRTQRMPLMSPRAPDGRGGAAVSGPDDFGPAGERDGLTDVPGGVRLQKVLAAAGVGSRRHCEELIGAGRVEVDGETVRRFGARVDPQQQVIRVDGRRIPARQDLVYLALNKPAGVLTTMSDDRGRPTIADFLGDHSARLY